MGNMPVFFSRPPISIPLGNLGSLDQCCMIPDANIGPAFSLVDYCELQHYLHQDCQTWLFLVRRRSWSIGCLFSDHPAIDCHRLP